MAAWCRGERSFLMPRPHPLVTKMPVLDLFVKNKTPVLNCSKFPSITSIPGIRSSARLRRSKPPFPGESLRSRTRRRFPPGLFPALFPASRNSRPASPASVPVPGRRCGAATGGCRRGVSPGGGRPAPSPAAYGRSAAASIPRRGIGPIAGACWAGDRRPAPLR